MCQNKNDDGAKKQFELAINPEKARAIRRSKNQAEDEACSMCGK